jgi:actin-related protein
LSLSHPMTYSGIVDDRPGFLLFLEYCLSSLEEQHIRLTNTTQVIVSYKSNYEINDYRLFSDLFFDKHNLPVVCYLHESLLTSIGSHQNSCLVIDIGSNLTSIVPIFESFIMKHCIRSTRVGGEHLTEFLELLIDAQGIDVYSSQLIRRRQEFSRHIKEKYAFVAPSFEEFIDRYGRFTFDYLQVMHPTVAAAPSSPRDGEGGGGLRCIQSSRSEHTAEIQISESFQCNDGTAIKISIDRELFYCSEVLFAPFLHETCQNEQSLLEVILSTVDSIDESVRAEICQTIVLDGETSRLKGFKERLEMDLRDEMKKRGVDNFTIIPLAPIEENQLHQQRGRWQGADRFISDLNSTKLESVSIPSTNIITSGGYDIEGLGIFSDLS